MARTRKYYLKKQLFDLEVKGPTKVIMVCDTPPYGHASTYQIDRSIIFGMWVHDHKMVYHVP
jgi:hypothetical protein